MFYKYIKICIHTFIIVSTLLIIFPKTNFAQCQWVGPIRITNGYIDKNPSFGSLTRYLNFPDYEYLVFERYTGSLSKICVLKMGLTAPIDTPITLVSNNYINRNPAIAYSFFNQANKAFVIWETNKNGRWDLYGSVFTYPQGWSQPFPVDTLSSYNKYNPQLYLVDTSRIDIVYEKNNDIIYRKCINGVVQTETNLTLNEPLNCRKPYLTNMLPYYDEIKLIITYEKIISANQKAINFITKYDTSVLWSSPDTVAYIGLNNNIGFSPPYICCLFESNRLGNWNLYATQIDNINNKYQSSAVINLNASNYGLVTTTFPPPIFNPFPNSQSFAYLKKFYDSTQIVYGYIIPQQSNSPIYLGDTTKSTKLAINTGIYAGWATIRVWIIFSKDSASYTNLYGIYNTICMDVKKISDEIPFSFSLSQNYPNPFNPTTNIIYQIPKSSFVKLTVYDVLGKEVSVLVNEKLQPGTFEVEFDGSNYSSGVYFYKLKTESFNQTKRMVLIK